MNILDSFPPLAGELLSGDWIGFEQHVKDAHELLNPLPEELDKAA